MSRRTWPACSATLVLCFFVLGCASRSIEPAPAGPPPVGRPAVSVSADRLLVQLERIIPGERAGMAVAIVEDGREAIVLLGASRFGEDTLFEFASVTKVMTASILAQVVLDGVVRLDTKVSELLPLSSGASRWDDVTLFDLATHTAGLPNHPPNLGLARLGLGAAMGDPFGRYDVDMLLRGIARTRFRSPGTVSYSNFGYAVLGAAVSAAANAGYEELLEERIFRPAGMADATVSGFSSEEVAPPLNLTRRRGSNWSFLAFAPAGGARGSIRDGLAFLRVSMEACARSDRFSRALCFAQRPAGPSLSSVTDVGLGWFRTRRRDAEVVWHNGGTGGYSTFLGFASEGRKGVVILANAGWLRQMDAAALRFLGGPEADASLE